MILKVEHIKKHDYIPRCSFRIVVFPTRPTQMRVNQRTKDQIPAYQDFRSFYLLRVDALLLFGAAAKIRLTHFCAVSIGYNASLAHHN